jgi:cytochrome c556
VHPFIVFHFSPGVVAMKRVALLGLALAVVAGASFAVQAQVKKGKTRAALTKQIMSGIVQANCAALGKGTKDAPTDDKGWEALATNAALLNEASYLLMDDGRCPDGDWAGAAKALRAGSEAMLAQIEAKDAAGAAAAFKGVTDSCAACHKAHKK